jgi:hypothetical protein
VKTEKNVTHKIIPHSSETLASKNADQYRFKERKFTKVSMKFQVLSDTVKELSYNIHHIDSNFKGKKNLKL